MDSRRLEYFVAVVDHGGFTAASRAIFVSQPALSLAVKELEADVATPLFSRVGRRVHLTAAGSALLGPARQVLRDLETGRAAVAAVAGLEAGSLSLASLPTLAADPLAALVGRFHRHHPGVGVELASPEDSLDLFDSVITGRSEVGLTDARDIPDALESVALGSQTLVFILPPGWSSSQRWQPVGPDGNQNAPFVAAPEGTSTRRLLDEHLASAGLQPHLAVVSAQRDAILPLVLAGAGAALVPESMALIAERLGAVVSRPDPPAIRQVALVYRSGPLSPAASRFLELAVAPAPEPDPDEIDPSSSGIRTRAASPSEDPT
jgi:LysR family transcriptional regulator, carnitine catabolism transcriptional activator